MFVEVKTRSQKRYGNPAEAVDKRKKKHIYHAAEYFMLINRIENLFCRIDVIEVYIYENNIRINHLKNSILEKPYRKFEIKEEDEFL